MCPISRYFQCRQKVGEYREIGHFHSWICEPREEFRFLMHWKSGSKKCPSTKSLLIWTRAYGWISWITSLAKSKNSKTSESLPSIQQMYITSISPPLLEQRAWTGRRGKTPGIPGWGIRTILKEWAKRQHTVIILRILNLRLEKFLSRKQKIFHRHNKRIWWLH